MKALLILLKLYNDNKYMDLQTKLKHKSILGVLGAPNPQRDEATARTNTGCLQNTSNVEVIVTREARMIHNNAGTKLSTIHVRYIFKQCSRNSIWRAWNIQSIYFLKLNNKNKMRRLNYDNMRWRRKSAIGFAALIRLLLSA